MIKNDASQLRYLIAGYGMPGEYGMTTLFGYGCKPDQIRLLTHKADERNTGLIQIAKLRGIEFQSSNPQNDAIAQWVEEFDPHIILSLHYRNLIPPRILKTAKIGSINLHPSLLPKYRGANSTAWAIINGETRTGFTFHHMSESFDTGRILIQEEIEVTLADTAFSLFHRQIVSAMKRLDDAITMISSNVFGREQTGESSYHGRDLPFGGVIDPTWSIENIDRFIRAMYFPPFNPATVHIGNKSFPVYSLKDYKEIISSMKNGAKALNLCQKARQTHFE